MSTRVLKLISEQGKYGVGNLNTVAGQIKYVPNGAVALADMDNYILAELGDYDVDGNLTCKPLSDAKKVGYLVTTIEENQLQNLGGFQEQYNDFFNGKGEMVRLVVIEPTITRFETSSFTLNSGVLALAVGQVAHFDVATKKFIVSAKGSAHADYAAAANKFTVVETDSDFGSGLGIHTIKLAAL